MRRWRSGAATVRGLGRIVLSEPGAHGKRLGLARRALCTGLVLALLAAPGAAAAASPCAPLRAHGAPGDHLVVGFAAAAPFVVTGANDGQVHGFAIELLRTLAARQGWKLELVELSTETLRSRLEACELDVGVMGVPVSAELARTLDLSQPYLSTVTTVMVNADDAARAGPGAGVSAGEKLVHALGRGLVYGVLALLALGAASWFLNAFSGFRGTRRLHWRRMDSTVSGPWAGLRWLLRSTTGRVLATVWIVAGVVLGATGRTGAARPLVLGEDPLRRLVERAAHTETLVGERYPDGENVHCAANEARDCFRGFGEGMLAAMAGPREILCAHALDLSLDHVVLRHDLEIPEHFAYLLPRESPLRARLDVALLEQHEAARVHEPVTHCPGEPW